VRLHRSAHTLAYFERYRVGVLVAVCCSSSTFQILLRLMHAGFKARIMCTAPEFVATQLLRWLHILRHRVLGWLLRANDVIVLDADDLIDTVAQSCHLLAAFMQHVL